MQIEVESGIDWFDVHGQANFDDQLAELPELLQAIARGEKTVRLDDGTYGMLPEQWLKRYAPLAQFSQEQDGQVRFGRNQVGLLDAMLAELPEADVDAQFQKARHRLNQFSGIKPKDPPASFQGELRDYQCEGLGWLHFLRRFGFGGCLADDMGLGKTIQVLAMLESRRKQRRKRDENGRPGPPSLVVAPRSLMDNWQREAATFTPHMRVLKHLGPDRWRDETGGKITSPGFFRDYDLVLTTYATMRLDIDTLKDLTFDYAILDEAQAIKNPTTAAAKAARLLQANHRLALSGTPVENNLNELYSLFEFLNPGMLGRQTKTVRSVTRSGKTNGEDETNGDHKNEDPTPRILATAVRPFLLRRTKRQVAKELPERSEQTLYCELEGKQHKQYEQIRQHYRQSLLRRVEQKGLNQSKMHVLEALLRLRQAACHPGLIDQAKQNQSSAKIDTLWPQLQEIIAEGDKALVFSQFTSLLKIVRDKLDATGIGYAYLDGSTSKRSEQVQRFQNNAECQVFLISLKAGGLGLNLTAAGYVFLLDPWWNPAVEAQAIDRTHRIGQQRQVFAYRLIARNTVEEKILELQQQKRDLAEAIISEDQNLIRDLTAEDLRWLLS
jgi:SNF2 family DNA or RNA helicase